MKSEPASREVAGSASGIDVESVAKAGRRRTFTAADKLRIVCEADACTERGEVQALPRREGIYSSHLAAWRRQLAELGTAGLGTAKRGRPPKQDPKDKRISELEKRATRLEAKLALAEKLIALQKRSLGDSGNQAGERGRRLMDTIEEFDDPTVSIARACEALGVSRATLYRRTQPPRPPMPRRAPSPRRLASLTKHKTPVGVETMLSFDYEPTDSGTTYPRDGLGRIKRKMETELVSGTSVTTKYRYEYDLAGRLTDVYEDGVLVEHYVYGVNGTRTSVTKGGTTTSATYDDQDRLLTFGGTTYGWTRPAGSRASPSAARRRTRTPTTARATCSR